MNEDVAGDRGVLYVVSAPSGGGKTSLTRAAVERLSQIGHEVAISVSYTTRPPRPGEVDGTHYHFVDGATFERMIRDDAFLEHAEVFGHRYGTGRDATQRLLDRGCDVLLDIDWQGGRQVRERAANSVGVFILPPSTEALRERLAARGQDDPEVVARRMAAARAEMAHYGEYDYLLINDRFEQTLEEFVAIVRTQRLRGVRQAHRHGALIATLLETDRPIR